MSVFYVCLSACLYDLKTFKKYFLSFLSICSLYANLSVSFLNISTFVSLSVYLLSSFDLRSKKSPQGAFPEGILKPFQTCTV